MPGFTQSKFINLLTSEKANSLYTIHCFTSLYLHSSTKFRLILIAYLFINIFYFCCCFAVHNIIVLVFDRGTPRCYVTNRKSMYTRHIVIRWMHENKGNEFFFYYKWNEHKHQLFLLVFFCTFCNFKYAQNYHKHKCVVLIGFDTSFLCEKNSVNTTKLCVVICFNFLTAQ